MCNGIGVGVLLAPGLTRCNHCCSVAMGYDEGTALIKIGREEPVASMDSSGKIIWAHHNEIQTVNVKSLGADTEDVSISLVNCGLQKTLSAVPPHVSTQHQQYGYAYVCQT